MALLTLRSVKGTPLTNNEVDTNFTNLNTDIGSIQSSISTINSDISAIESQIGVNIAETIADVVGGMVSSNSESGITVTYQDGDNTLDFDVADWSLTIDGDASGTATITNLGNTTLTLDITTITGDVVVGGDVSAANFNSTSDVALKKNLSVIESPIEKLSKLNGYTFNWKQNDQEAIGIVAQEIEKVFPQMVVTGQDGIKRVSYDSLIPVLLEAIKELAKR